jgi:ABC-type polysaccharide/polyol phosphate transport system ATPase subunit
MRTATNTRRENFLRSPGTHRSMTEECRPPILELVNVSKWDAPASLIRRYHRNEALQSLIELCVVLWQAKNFSKGYLLGERLETLLDDVSISIPFGCVAGVVDIGGRSKTAFLNVVGNVEPPSRGEIRFYGRVGSTAQINLASRPQMTCQHNLVKSARIAGVRQTDIHSALERIDAFSGLGKYLGVPQRRVPKWVVIDLAISLLCCFDLDLLIADEVALPVSDTVERNWAEYLRSAPEKGRTVLVAGKRIDKVIKVSTHLLLIDDGRIRAFGPAHEVRERHAEFLQTASATAAQRQRRIAAPDPEDDDDDDDF